MEIAGYWAYMHVNNLIVWVRMHVVCMYVCCMHTVYIRMKCAVCITSVRIYQYSSIMHMYMWTSWEKKVGFEEKRIMEKNGFEVPGVWGMGGVGKFPRNFWVLSWKSPGGSIIKIGIVKKEIKIFTIGLWGNYPTIMVDPPVEYLKMCNFPQITPFFSTRSHTWIR